MPMLSRRFVTRSMIGIVIVAAIALVVLYVANEWTRRILPGLSGGLTSYSTSLSPTRLRFGDSNQGFVDLTLPRAYLVYKSEIKKRTEGLSSFTIEIFMPDLSPWAVAYQNPDVWPNDLRDKKNRMSLWPESYARITVTRRSQATNLDELLKNYASGAVKETEDDQVAVYRQSYPRTEHTASVYAFKASSVMARCPAQFLYCEMTFAAELHSVPVLIRATIPSRSVLEAPNSHARVVAFLNDRISVSGQ